MLRNFGFLGILTAFLWLLSPLGGQAISPRLISLENQHNHTSQSIDYLGPRFLEATGLTGASGAASVVNIVSALYYSSLMAAFATRKSPRDLWNNIKMPSLKDFKTPLSSTEWTDVHSDNGFPEYSNLVGLPIGVTSNAHSSNLTIMSTHLNLSCSSLQLTDIATFKDNLQEALFLGQNGGTYPNGTTEFFLYQPSLMSGLPTHFLLMTNASWYEFLSNTSHPITIYYGSKTNGRAPNVRSNPRSLSFSISLATCKVVPVSLEYRISCTGTSCSAVAARMANVSSTTHTFLTDSVQHLLKDGYFCGMGAAVHANSRGLTEQYLMAPDDMAGHYGLADVWSLPLLDFETRLEQTLNTFLYLSRSDFKVLTTANFSGIEATQQANATVTFASGQYYRCDWVWLSLGLAALVVLECLAIMTVILRHLTHVPDVLGYVSSLTIESPYLKSKEVAGPHRGAPIPGGPSSAMDGMERSRALGDTYFRLVDVYGMESVGKIGFVPVKRGGIMNKAAESPIYSKVKLGRWYS